MYVFLRAGEWDLLINLNKCSCLNVGNHPPLLPSFSATDANHKIPTVTYPRDLGVPRDTTFTSSVRCRQAANTARRSSSELSKTAFIHLYFNVVQPHLDYAIKPTQRNSEVIITI